MIVAEDINIFQGKQTPFYFYDLKRLHQVVLQALKAADKRGYRIHYALKSNANPDVVDVFVKRGLGVDCVSGEEVRFAIRAGFKPHQIAFAGVGKTDQEIDLAIREELFSLNVESLEELEVIAQRSMTIGKPAYVALRLNPDINARTHRYITTGLEENKFGIGAWQLDQVIAFLKAHPQIRLRGLHFHIGSQITDLEPFRNLCSRINKFQQIFHENGFTLQHINAGGGLGVNYEHPDEPNNPDFESYFSLFEQYLEVRPGQQVHFELGRSLVATCGDLISRVIYVKHGQKTNFLILDAGMTELIRPALYQSFHLIENLSRRGKPMTEKYDVVGPVCESSDCFGKSIMLPESHRGDLVAIRVAGAYGESMASNYNLRHLQKPVIRF